MRMGATSGETTEPLRDNCDPQTETRGKDGRCKSPSVSLSTREGERGGRILSRHGTPAWAPCFVQLKRIVATCRRRGEAPTGPNPRASHLIDGKHTTRTTRGRWENSYSTENPTYSECVNCIVKHPPRRRPQDETTGYRKVEGELRLNCEQASISPRLQVP
ncbi:hypothetical protein BC826DRAFT_325189 [Russula brevipes]|nr:hypothetical protein BC826DRAFT_325189 [Russula brevipes]